ncbi:7TM diverse intracellular signaling domain-containing protein, partial [Novosphingobium bradum]
MSTDPVRTGIVVRCVLFLLLLLAAGLATLALLRVGSSDSMHLSTCVAPQRAGDTPQAVLAAPSRFDCDRQEAKWGPGSYWVRLTPPPGRSWAPPGDDGVPRIQFVPQWQRMLAVYARDTSGRIVTRDLDNVVISHMVGIGGAVVLELEGHKAPLREVLFRVDGAVNNRGLIGPVHLVSSRQTHADELAATAIFAGFAGLGIGLFCYNFVLWLTIRERFQLTYCASLVTKLAYVWTSSGMMAITFPGIPQDWRMATSFALLACLAALTMKFITDVIEPGMIPSRLRWVARNYGLLMLLGGAGLAMAPADWRYLADRAYVYCFVPLPFMVMALTFLAWRRGSQAVRVLAIGWAVPLVTAIIRLAYALHLIPFGPAVQYSLVIGMGGEALLASLAMSYRIKLISAERDRARADEQAARHLANVDSLTGLLNRRALLDQVVAWASPEPLRLLIIDIDHFKQVNDTH